MRIARFVKGLAVLAVLAVAVLGAGFQTKSADAQSPFVFANGPYSGSVGVPLTFSATVSPAFGPIAGATWTFSDGVAINGLSVSRVFNHAGPFSATVTVSNTFGSVQSSLASVSILGVNPIVVTSFVGPQVCATTDSSAPRVVCTHGAVVHPAISTFPVVHGAISTCLSGLVVIGGQVVCGTHLGAFGTPSGILAYCLGQLARPLGFQAYCPGLR
jgi:hypothetical protein